MSLGTTMLTSGSHTSLRIILLLLASVMAGVAQAQERTERWLGYYQHLGSDEKFHIYLELIISAESVSGRSVDLSEVASVYGTLVNNQYKLLLHPLDEDESREQDIYFRGKYIEDKIVGEWEHFVGVKGYWQAERTMLGAKEALAPYRKNCSSKEIVQKESSEGCGNGA